MSWQPNCRSFVSHHVVWHHQILRYDESMDTIRNMDDMKAYVKNRLTMPQEIPSSRMLIFRTSNYYSYSTNISLSFDLTEMRWLDYTRSTKYQPELGLRASIDFAQSLDQKSLAGVLL